MFALGSELGVFKLPKMLCAPLGSVGTLQNSALLPGCRTISVCLSFEHLATATAGKFMELVSISVRTRTIRRTYSKHKLEKEVLVE